MNKRHLIYFVFAVAGVFALAGCISGGNDIVNQDFKNPGENGGSITWDQWRVTMLPKLVSVKGKLTPSGAEGLLGPADTHEYYETGMVSKMRWEYGEGDHFRMNLFVFRRTTTTMPTHAVDMWFSPEGLLTGFKPWDKKTTTVSKEGTTDHVVEAAVVGGLAWFAVSQIKKAVDGTAATAAGAAQ